MTEQYYLLARYYNPVLGRFMQEDVYQGDGLNLYVYCGNNPVVYYDPTEYAGASQQSGYGCPPASEIADSLDAADDQLVTVYRGTSNEFELIAYDETGSLMSDSARIAYYETDGDIDYAFATSQKNHEQWISIWGDEDT